MAQFKIKDGACIIPYGVTVIKREAFKNCSKLKSIVIPESVTEIGYGAFKDCPAKIIGVNA